MTATQVPLFTSEDSEFYDAAFRHNSAFATGSPYKTTLSSGDEAAFRTWVTNFGVPFDPDATRSNYDMRRYWLLVIKPGGTWLTGSAFPIVNRTPYSTAFSVDSVYAVGGCPFVWTGSKLFDTRDGSLVFWADYRAGPEPAKTTTPHIQTDTAVKKIERSQLDTRSVQRELMGKDLNLKKLSVYLKSKIKFDAEDQLIDVNVTRTIEGASTVVVTINDYERTILNSGLLSSSLDIQLDGLWFRLVKVSRTAGASQIDLTFEDREIAILRSYPKKGAAHGGIKIAHRSKTTRAEFILNLIREVREIKIPVVIPELHKVQPIEKSAGSTVGVLPLNMDQGINTGVAGPDPTINPRLTTPGVAKQFNVLNVKGTPATPEQIKNANTIIAVGRSMGVSRKLQVCAIMTAITESTIHNLPGGDNAHGGGVWDSAGIFQQDGDWGSYRDRTDVATSARLFFNAAKKKDAEEPNAPYWTLCADVQNPRNDLRTVYGLYRTEADRMVTASGNPGGKNDTADANLTDRSAWGGSNSASDYVYYRGVPKEGGKFWKRENNWDCIQRLANEVQWRAFFVSGVFYLVAEEDLFKTQPIMIIDETSQGIEGIGFDYDIGKKFATVDIPMRVGTWLVPPGGVVALQHMGPVSGRWIVSDFTRSVFDSKADVSLKKPMPTLPEAIQSDLSTIPTWATSGTDPVAKTPNIDTNLVGGAAENAGLLQKNPNWHDDNGRGRSQLESAALGQKIVNQAGQLIDLDPRVPGVILWLINQGYTIGTFAWAADHSVYSSAGLVSAHSQGKAVDISSIDGIAINQDTPQARAKTLEVATLLHNMTGDLAPAQLICGGYGNHADFSISMMTIPSAGYYGEKTMSEHTNHIHVGY